MRLAFNKYLAITVTLLCFSNMSFAGTVKTINCGSGTYDYGDAGVSSNGTVYGEACHDTNRWQQLGGSGRNNPLEGDSGASSDADNENKGWSGETSQNANDKGDNGVTWRIKDSNDDWGRGELAQGDVVEFQFKVKRSNEGNHQFDQLKAWIDWNGNGTFDESENIIDEKWYKVADSFAAGNTTGNQLGGYNNDPLVRGNNGWNSIRNSDITISKITTAGIQIPFNNVVSDTWMRARIICENSLVANNDYTLSSIGYYHQGEVEDYKLKISQVPEPTTLLVFGSALFGLVLSRKKTQ